MHPLLDVRPWPRILLQYPLLLLTAALLGAGGAFAYSYAPLHRAKDWKIEYLEGRLESRSEQVAALEEELRAARSSIEDRPSGDQLDALNSQLAEAQGVSGSLEKQVRELEKQLEEVTRSRDSWRQKHASVVREIESLQAAGSAPAPAPSHAAPDDDSSHAADAAGSTAPDATEEAAPAAPASAAGRAPDKHPTP